MINEYTDPEYGLGTIPINPNNFPAKLWKLVNNPQIHSVCWDASGLGIIIDQQMFEDEVMSPANGSRDQNKLFQTTNFSSFIRQLNLYGFRKVVAWLTDAEIPKEINVTLIKGLQHCFYSPNFKRGHPELLLKMIRLTTTNKAKIEEGLEVNSRPPNLFWHALIHNTLTENNESTQAPPAMGSFQGNTSVYPLPVNSSNHTSLPQTSWTMVTTDSRTQSTCFVENGIPGPVIQCMPTWPVQSVSTAVVVQPVPQAVAPPAQYQQPGYYAPAQ